MATRVKAKKSTVFTFRKEQLVNSKKYSKYRDFLKGNLEENRTYSFREVDKIIKNFYGRSDV